MAGRAQISGTELQKLLDLVRDADSVELKLTLPESARAGTAAALGVDPLDAQIRQVFFFDTPDLALNAAGVVVRARRRQGEEADTVIKLRPVVPAELPEELRRSKMFNVEVDAMPGGFVCSASFKGAAGNDAIREVAGGARSIRKLFSKAQRAFYATHAPDGLELDQLSVLGPIPTLKLKIKPKGFGRRLVGELSVVSGRLSDRRALHEGPAVRGHAGRRRGASVPLEHRRRPGREAADQDEDRARVLRGCENGVSRPRTKMNRKRRAWSERAGWRSASRCSRRSC